jgi:hypothetical protein
MSRFEAWRWAAKHWARQLGDPWGSLAPSDVAICTVHGNNAELPLDLIRRCSWPRLQIEQLRRYTPEGYSVYAYCNDLLPEHEEHLRSCSEVRVFSSRQPTFYAIRSVWAIRNWLARQAAQHHRLIVHLDSDALPVRRDWIERYAKQLCWRSPVAAVQRLENGDSHSDRCFLMYRRIDLHRHLFDLSSLDVKDAGAAVSADLEKKGLGWVALRRSNAHDYHPLIAGIYDDRVYHHAAGSRAPRFRQNHPFWSDEQLMERERRIHRFLMERLFADPDAFLAELRGERPPVDLEAALPCEELG